MAHGGGTTFGAIAHVSALIEATPPESPPVSGNFPGFSYFLGAPAAGQQSKWGTDLDAARPVFEALHGLLPTRLQVDNPRIPAGYTYLLQLIAHDLVESSEPFWHAAKLGIAGRNKRQESLQFDTLYGGGPSACPIAFEPDVASANRGPYLRLGRVADAAVLGLVGGPCPLRDLARSQHAAGPGAGATVAAANVFVADARNDDSVILSQVVVLFSILHNAIIDKLPGLAPEERYVHARAAMLQMYLKIIRQDLLRRLLHDAVYGVLESRSLSSTEWLWSGGKIPLELSHGALRVCHAMVRSSYVLTQGMSAIDIEGALRGPNGGTVRDPLPSSWIVAWSNFFDHGGTPNLSMALRATRSLALDRGGLPLPVAANATNIPDNLSLRDWLSAAAARTWKIDALVAAVRPHFAALQFIGEAEIRLWLERLIADAPAMDHEKEVVKRHSSQITRDPPLPLYCLLEAQLDPGINGRHLGALGSIIVGEVLFRRLAEEEAKLGIMIPGARAALGAANWGRIQGVDSMPALINLTEDWGDLAACNRMPFI